MKISQVCTLPAIDFVKMNLNNPGLDARTLNDLADIMQQCYDQCGNLPINLSKVAEMLDKEKLKKLLAKADGHEFFVEGYLDRIAQAILDGLSACEKE